MRRILIITLAIVALIYATLGTVSCALQPQGVGDPVAPPPEIYPDAIVQVYGADVWGLRGRFAMHTWIATKAAGARNYTKYQVIGWRQRRGQSVLSVTTSDPDGDWFGASPVLLHERRGPEAQALVEAVHHAALAYPHADEYVMWPGPNSNSFTAWVGLRVPELGLELPAKAIGKNWMLDSYSPDPGHAQ